MICLNHPRVFLQCLRVALQAPKVLSAARMPPRKRKNEQPISSSDSVKKNKASSNFDGQVFSSDAKTSSGEVWNFKISTWNVDGLRAMIKKGGLDYLKYEKPDVICFQEIKCSEEKLPAEVKELTDYSHQYWHPARKEGYSGVAVLSRQKPISVKYGLGEVKEAEEFNNEGRLITAEFEHFFLVTVYVPNAGAKLVTLPKRMTWDTLFRSHVERLDKEKPVIVCGDLNVAHKEIDLANPKTNQKHAGFTKEERQGLDQLLQTGLVDTFRHFYPDTAKAYTFWTYLSNARAKNVGWRLDYFLASERFIEHHICDNLIRDQVFGSDHCPVTLLLALGDSKE